MISERIGDELDLICFRSICSTWHSSSVPNHLCHILPVKFPLLKFPFRTNPNDIDTIKNNTTFCNLSKQNIFLIKPPQQEEQTLTLRPWLIRTNQNTLGQTNCFHPLPRSLSFDCRFVLDYNKLSAVHLRSTFFILDLDLKFKNRLYNCNNYIYPQKVVAVTCHGKKPLVIGTLISPPQPLLVKCGNEKWKVIPDMSTKFGDIFLFKGRPYAVDKIGKTIMVRLDSSVQLVPEPLVGGGNNKFSVESEGDLLLEDIYECLCIDLNDLVRIDLFKLNEKEKKWVKLSSLRDRVLFLGLVCSFSASASDLRVAKGNCVIFISNIFERNMISKCESYVLDLDQGRLSTLVDCPKYSNLFWPPQRWMKARHKVCYFHILHRSKGF